MSNFVSGVIHRVAPLTLAMAIISVTSLSAEKFYTVKLDPKAETGKLSPDLIAAHRTESTFVGVTEDGAAVLKFPADMDDREIESKLADVPGFLARSPRDHRAYDELSELIVIHEAGQPFRRGDTFAGCEIINVVSRLNFIVIHSHDGFSPGTLSQLLEFAPLEHAHPNYHYRLAETPNDAKYSKQWALPGIDAPAAWERVTTSPVVVAVLDTGICFDPPNDLTPNMSANVPERDGVQGIDDDGNGCYDDVYGCNFVELDPNGNYTGNGADTYGHGTHCAGIIGARGDNNDGIAGVCWQVPIVSVRIFESGQVAGDEAKLALGIEYAVRRGARVLNCSFAGPNIGQNVKNAIALALNSGALLVCAAGNGGNDAIGDDNGLIPTYPASYASANIISVLSVDEDYIRDPSSNFGNQTVHIAAPGVNIYSTMLQLPYGSASGTSMAAAHVAGAAALIWNHPDYLGATYDIVKQAIITNRQYVQGLQNDCVAQGVLNLAFLDN